MAPGRILAKKCHAAMQKGIPSTMATHHGEIFKPRSTVNISAWVVNVLVGTYEMKLPAFIMQKKNIKRASMRLPCSLALV